MSNSRNSSESKRMVRYKTGRRDHLTDRDDDLDLRNTRSRRSKKKTWRNARQMFDRVDLTEVEDMVLEIDD